MIRLLGSKKAQNSDNIILPIIFVFIIALIFIFSTIVGTQIITGFRTVYATPAMSQFNSPEIQQTLDDYERVYSIYDKMLLALVVSLILGIGWTSYRLSTSPFFYIVTMVLGLFYCFFGYIMSYVFIQFVTNPSIVSIMYLFPLTIMVCTNLHWFGIALVLVGAISLYAKKPVEAIPLR